jgi:pimeloyl-ACP methyl ester carboxylesterase
MQGWNLAPFRKLIPEPIPAERNMPSTRTLKRKFNENRSTILATGVALMAAAAWVQYKTRKAETEHPPRGQFIEVEGVRLHYIERGEGEPVIFIHGNGSMAEDVDISGLIDAMASRYRVIVFDRPGYGYSERPRTTIWTPQAQADLLYTALTKLGVDRPIVAAHSLGTQVAIALAVKHPYHVRSLVLLSGYYYPTARLDVPFMSVPAIPVLGDLMRYTISPLLSRVSWPAFVRKMFQPLPAPEQFDKEFPVWLALRPSQLRASAAESALMIPCAALLRKHYQELTMPVVIVAGDADHQVDTYKQSVRLHDDLPHSILQIIPGAGHMLHYSAAEQILSALEAAVDEAALDESEPVRRGSELRSKPLTEEQDNLPPKTLLH